MIKAYIYRNDNNEVYGFKINDHGDPIVCSAVSALTINTINSIESFTDEHIIYEYEEKGGFLVFEMPDIKSNSSNANVKLLMDSMMLGLESIKTNHGKHIKIYDN